LPHSVHKIMRGIDEGSCVDVVFLDLTKAFDKVPRQGLLEKLRKNGFGGNQLSRREKSSVL